ncbi:hypothetical protein Pmar_PMAR003237 [Perkinsus marinus ATCC 50983]|uniref:Uncharacterized protein n=1 Tax=Perkinsus marinus (strain ATCC 50983 / TXsc) TaxID=423536 RepID=C5LKJ7_PERM5|nr:hypothetical protein Pmar_PMAR003237 [Perkinsus marinus ATCC 50983]EER02764.1 hypothetical protein Pmar_PMAR003237 [Perkinsus marinus ATCC 50983]|eukprot:XP_002770948.1 hypothetical protein Pmar_PMAR003237 [Perkinsus marinus ATCC 50983]
MAKRGFDEMLIDDNSMDVESTTDEDRESVDDQNDHIETSCGLCGGPRRKKFRPKLMSWSNFCLIKSWIVESMTRNATEVNTFSYGKF